MGDKRSPTAIDATPALMTTTSGAAAYSSLARSTRLDGLRMVRPTHPSARGCLHPLDRECARGRAVARIDEYHQRRAADVEGELRRQLMPLDDSHPIEPRVVGKAFCGVPAEPIVGAQGVAVADDEDLVGHRMSSSRTAPSGPMSWRWRAISPRAWVEHDRHGSKQRMTASTRLSIGSLSWALLT